MIAKYEVRCSECKDKLKLDLWPDPMDRLWVTAHPCRTCMANAEAKGRDEPRYSLANVAKAEAEINATLEALVARSMAGMIRALADEAMKEQHHDEP